MEMEAIYGNIPDKVGPRTPSQNPTEAQISRRWFVVITVGLGLICVLLVITLILQYIHLTAERDQMKMRNMNIAEEYNENLSSLSDERDQMKMRNMNIAEEYNENLSSLSDERDQMKMRNMKKVKEYNETLTSLKINFSHLIDERDQLQKNLKSMSEMKSELEINFSHLTDVRDQLQKNLTSMSEMKSELETKVKNLNDVLMKSTSGSCRYFISSVKKNWTDSRQFCRDWGGDLVIINTEEEQKYISSIVKEKVWIGLSDTEKEGNMKWVDNTPLNKGFWEDNQPNNYNGNQDCVEIIPTKPFLKNWNDRSCSDTRKWICEK